MSSRGGRECREWDRPARAADVPVRVVRPVLEVPVLGRLVARVRFESGASGEARPSSEFSFAAIGPMNECGSLGLAVSASSLVSAAAVGCDFPKYHLKRPISSTPPAVASISGKRSMSG